MLINFSKVKGKLSETKLEERCNNFSEVSENYTEERAMREAMRCLKCRDKPCSLKGCPINQQIPEFIAKVSVGEFEEAYKIIKQRSALPAICGRICPHESQCEGACVRKYCGDAVGIGSLERFVADWYANNCDGSVDTKEGIVKNKKNVAIIGAGPSGLTCAGDLLNMGYNVTIYDSYSKAGGVLAYGIPQFRLPKHVLEREIKILENKGVKFVFNTTVGKDMMIKELISKYDAVYISNGANEPVTMDIPGKDLEGVYSAFDYLRTINEVDIKTSDDISKLDIPKAKKIFIIGGGNVAIDCARSARRVGAEVTIIYRRGFDEMPAFRGEIIEAQEEGVNLMLLTDTVEVLGDENGKVRGIKCIKMILGDQIDSTGRLRPVKVEGSEFEIEAECVIMAVGSGADHNLTNGVEFEKNRKGYIVTNVNKQTSISKVFAGGDTVTGPLTVVRAMGDGKKAAVSIDAYIKSMA